MYKISDLLLHLLLIALFFLRSLLRDLHLPPGGDMMKSQVSVNSSVHTSCYGAEDMLLFTALQLSTEWLL